MNPPPTPETDLDDELATFTDALMADQRPAPHGSTEAQELAAVARQLYTLIDPNRAPDQAARMRLTARLSEEWTRTHSGRSAVRFSWTSTQVRFIALAAALVLIALAVLTWASGGVSTGAQSGAAVGSITPGFAAFFAILVIGAVIAILVAALRRRR